MRGAAASDRVAAVRRFNRFYTQAIGVLAEGWADSAFSLAEARVLYEIANGKDLTASALARALRIDPGYLSRMLQGLAVRGLIARTRSKTDGRQQLLSMTEAGIAAFAPVEARTVAQVEATLHALSKADQERLVGAMARIERLLGAGSDAATSYVLRAHRPGDMGWIVAAHGRLYAEEYGWDGHEALIVDIVSEFLKTFDRKREHCWIAEQDGENVASVMLVKKSPTVAQLRAMLVVRNARGLGIGTRLVEECIRFARSAGYKTIRLWTQSILTEARHIYAKAGFRCVDRKRHRAFGKQLVAETWELKL
jgi:DNA-binding MarR family transcriptional regulator/N-acetylglutamate synthase-like GNAT family acetyltransferase